MIVYFAGMETTCKSYDILPKSTDNIFCTYFYRKNTDSMLEKFSKDKGHKGIITVDSGAHSFFGYTGTSTAAHHNGKNPDDMPDPEKYWRDYLKWIVLNYQKISFFVELDIGAIVGYDTVLRWRSEMRDAGVFDKCIMVMHSTGMDLNKSTMENFYALCEETESNYIGFEGLRAKKVTLPYGKMLHHCFKNKIKVHGFALTAKEVTTKYPFYSVDSTTWTVPLRYGTFLVIEDGSMKQVSPTKENYIKYGIDPYLNSNERSKEASANKLLLSMETQREYEIFLTKLWDKRGVKWHH